jgi:phosphoenolpyruvate phosphomutase
MPNNKAKMLRHLFVSMPILRIVGAHDAIGAKLIEKNGFEGVWASGLEISTAHGVPDANILTMTDYLSAAVTINQATSLPVVCDCDTGYGNASNVWHMVKKYESAGMAGVVIEDKLFPKVNSFIPGRQELASVEEFMGKIEAAKSAQHSADFMVFARVEALIAGWGLEEAWRRAYAYAEAGADGIVIHSKASTPDEIFAFAKKWKSPIPLVAIPTMYPEVTSEALCRHGFKMVIYANQGLRAAVKAVDQALGTIARTGSSALVESEIASMKEVFELQGMAGHTEQEKKFSKKETVQAVIPAAGSHQILKDTPLCMVSIGGKTLLDHQADILRSCGVSDILVVGGIFSEKIKADGVKTLAGALPQGSGSAASILAAKDHFKDKCLVAYSDILYDRLIVEQLLKSPHPITLVIDRAYQTLPFRDKKLDLVVAGENHQTNTVRRLALDPFKTILQIGQDIDKKKAGYEFIGMAYFKDGGLKILREAFDRMPQAGHRDFNDLIQYLIDHGQAVYGLEIEHGWSEIHSLEDLERVRAHFERQAVPALSTHS